jgi:mannose-6-phosphate isomerase-like protein (cupin superfamily)
MPDLAGYVAAPSDGGGPDVKATAATTAGVLSVMESVIRQGPPRHVRTHEDECFYVLDGTVAGTCGDEAFEAGPRSFVFLPRGLAHTFRAAQGEARVLLIAVPGGIEHYFGEINNADSVAEQERIGAKYGIRVVLAAPAATAAHRTTRATSISQAIQLLGINDSGKRRKATRTRIQGMNPRGRAGHERGQRDRCHCGSGKADVQDEVPEAEVQGPAARPVHDERQEDDGEYCDHQPKEKHDNPGNRVPGYRSRSCHGLPATRLRPVYSTTWMMGTVRARAPDAMEGDTCGRY